MAKISIADKVDGSDVTVLPRDIERFLWQGAIEGKERLGKSDELIEVIKITPIDSCPPLNVEVKIVIVEPTGSDKRISKIEAKFNLDYHEYADCLVETLSQRIVIAFQRTLGSRMNTLRFQAEELSSMLASIGNLERQSDNLGRCDECGKKMMVLEGGRLECERCKKNNPDCPSCGHKTTREGIATYKCLNCGTSVP